MDSLTKSLFYFLKVKYINIIFTPSLSIPNILLPLKLMAWFPYNENIHTHIYIYIDMYECIYIDHI